MFHEIKDLSSQDVFEMKISYHKSCYANIVHKHLIERGEKRLQMAKDSANISKVFTKNVGRPRKENLSDDAIRTTRHLFDKKLCLFCQETKQTEDLHNVEFENMGRQFLEIGIQSKNDVIKKRLSLLVASDDPLDAMAYDMKYHMACLMKNKRDCAKSSVDEVGISDEAKLRLIADLEIIDVAKLELNDEKDKVINMNEIQDTYLDILRGLGYCNLEKPNYKKYLKKLLLENLEDVHFNKPRRKNEAEQVMSTRASQVAIENSIDTVKNNYGVITEAAKVLRREIASIAGNFKEGLIILRFLFYFKRFANQF